MADLKPATIRSAQGIAPSRISPQTRVEIRPPVQSKPEVHDRVSHDVVTGQADPTAALISEFIEPASRTASWLGDPRFSATLQAALEALAPGGLAEDATDRYAASVIETHLVARRRLTKLTNALLKT